MAETTFTDADVQTLQEKLDQLSLTEREARALAALLGGELAQPPEIEPYRFVNVGWGGVQREG